MLQWWRKIEAFTLKCFFRFSGFFFKSFRYFNGSVEFQLTTEKMIRIRFSFHAGLNTEGVKMRFIKFFVCLLIVIWKIKIRQIWCIQGRRAPHEPPIFLKKVIKSSKTYPISQIFTQLQVPPHWKEFAKNKNQVSTTVHLSLHKYLQILQS